MGNFPECLYSQMKGGTSITVFLGPKEDIVNDALGRQKANKVHKCLINGCMSLLDMCVKTSVCRCSGREESLMLFADGSN